MTDSAPAYHVTTHEEEDGSLWAEVDELPGCFASGDDFDELWENLAEAVGLYLSTDDKRVVVTNARTTEVTPERKFELVTS